MLSKQAAEICSIIKTAHPGNFTDWQTELVFLSQQAFGVLNSYIRQVLVGRHACKLMELPADMVFTVAGCSQRLCNVKIRGENTDPESRRMNVSDAACWVEQYGLSRE